MTYHTCLKSTVAGVILACAALPAQADFVINDDLIVDGSACIGFDCVNGEAFGFDTIRLKENNLRIKFDDTSVAASFPRNDWQITANDSANGGTSKFSIDDITGSRTPFTIEAGARSHSLYVDDGGRIGIRTSTPSVELHIIDGDTPTMRLQQDTSSGFAAQTWDVAGNETNFFIRDVTNGSALPLRIRPGAPSSSIFIDPIGKIGLGTSSPAALLDLRRGGAGNDGLPRIVFDNTDAPADWTMDVNDAGLFRISVDGSGVQELSMDTTGNLTITGSLVTTGGGGACTVGDPCDAVFDPALYTVPSIEQHAALMWENKHLPAVGPTGPGLPIDVTEKMLRMLNELEHAHVFIQRLNDENKLQSAQLEEQSARFEEQGAQIEALKQLIATR